MDVRPIKNDKDYRAALKRIERLMGAKKDTPEGDALDVWATLVDAYERKRFPVDSPNPIAAIEHGMEALGLARKDLEPILGSRSRVSEVLGRKRRLTLEMVRRLHEKMGIPAKSLIQDYDLRV